MTELDTFTTFNSFDLRGGKPETLKLEIAIGYADSPCTGRKVIRNSWPIYVMPKVMDETLSALSKNIVITQNFDEATVSALEEGKKVLLLGKPLPKWERSEEKTKKSPEGGVDSPPDDIGGVGDRLATQEAKRESKRIKGLFMTDFWCYPMFKGSTDRKKLEPSPGTLGMLCDPTHPMFEHFPTERHTTWLWWHLIKSSNNVVLDAAPKDFRPIVQMIDNFARNHKIGMIFECKVGRGKLLVCCIDETVLRERPEGRQLLLSMLSYMNTKQFEPQWELSNEVLDKILAN